MDQHPSVKYGSFKPLSPPPVEVMYILAHAVLAYYSYLSSQYVMCMSSPHMEPWKECTTGKYVVWIISTWASFLSVSGAIFITPVGPHELQWWCEFLLAPQTEHPPPAAIQPVTAKNAGTRRQPVRVAPTDMTQLLLAVTRSTQVLLNRMVSYFFLLSGFTVGMWHPSPAQILWNQSWSLAAPNVNWHDIRNQRCAESVYYYKIYNNVQISI